MSFRWVDGLLCWSIGIESIVMLCLVSISSSKDLFSYCADDQSNVEPYLPTLSLLGDMITCLSIASARIKHSFRKEDRQGEAKRRRFESCILRASRGKDIDVCESPRTSPCSLFSNLTVSYPLINYSIRSRLQAGSIYTASYT
jgi:hypothetical protein